MQRSINFYTSVLGMSVLRSLEQIEENYSLTFLGYGSEAESCVLELTYNHGIRQYDMGTAYGHLAISVDNCYQACEVIEEQGGKITHPPFKLKSSNEVIAFITDPDGYQIELIQRQVNHAQSEI